MSDHLITAPVRSLAEYRAAVAGTRRPVDDAVVQAPEVIRFVLNWGRRYSLQEKIASESLGAALRPEPGR